MRISGIVFGRESRSQVLRRLEVTMLYIDTKGGVIEDNY